MIDYKHHINNHPPKNRHMENAAQKIEKTALACTDNGLHCRLHRRKDLIVSSTDFPR